MTRVLITGAAGRMGGALITAIADFPDLKIGALTERVGSPAVGTKINGVTVSSDFASALADADVVIDFTSPEATLDHVAKCAAAKKALVVGTTGLSPDAREKLVSYRNQIALVVAPNMSVGVNVLFQIAGEVARILGDAYDAEIVETHHRLKKDAPSGTALKLAEVVAESLGLNPQRDLVKTRDGQIGERPPKTVGVQSLRGGDVVGDHTVLFLGPGERVELTHKATSRGNFAQGALRAAKWVVRQPPGLYDMQDVLGLSARAGGR